MYSYLILTIIVKVLNCLFVVEKLSQGGHGVKMVTICLSKLPSCSSGSAGSF